MKDCVWFAIQEAGQKVRKAIFVCSAAKFDSIASINGRPRDGTGVNSNDSIPASEAGGSLRLPFARPNTPSPFGRTKDQ